MPSVPPLSGPFPGGETERHVFQHVPISEQVVVLKDKAGLPADNVDLPFCRPVQIDLLAVKDHRPSIRPLQEVDTSKERRLAGA